MRWLRHIGYLGLLTLGVSCASPIEEEAPAVVAPTLDSVVLPTPFFDQPISAAPLYFAGLLDSSYYHAPDSFRQLLCQLYQLPQTASISRYEMQYLYGYTDSITHLEIVYPEPIQKNCPYASLRQQLLFDAQGQLLYTSFADQAQFMLHALDSMPIYMEATYGCDGLGQHAIYHYQDGHLINVLNPILDHTPITYDVRADRSLFGKAGLRPRLEDLNADGYLDFVLEGKTYNEHRQRTPLRYVFTYIPAKEYYLIPD